MPSGECQVCSGREVEVFYRAEDVPVHQQVIHRTREEALACARGEMELGLCRACGFAFNLAFDPGKLAYSAGYDNTLTSSALFRDFLEQLARGLVDRYDLHGKRIVEVGSGPRGEFLKLLCELGSNTGVGFDPAYAGNGDAGADVQFVPELYSDEHLGHVGDFFCSRHVLEHLQHPDELVARIRRAIGEREGTPVYLETPSLEWILREGAFWDVFYEHCSYFSRGSLSHLLTANQFEVKEISDTFGDQFLSAEAAAADNAAGPPQIDPEILELADSFEERSDRLRERLSARIRELSSGGTCVLWGGGGKGVTLLNALGLGTDEVRAVVDAYPGKQGGFIAGTGHEIVAPNALREIRPAAVLVANPNYREEIAGTVAGLGLEPELVSVHG